MQSSIIAKLLSVLTVISETQKPLTFSELVKKSGLNKSTIHRLLAIGVEERLVQFDKHRKVYMLGSKVFDLVRNAYSGYDIQAVALDEMISLHARYDANVTIGIPIGMEVVYLRVLESPQFMGGVQRPGMREPVHCSASGKALMAFLPQQVLDARLEGYVFDQFTSQTINNVAAFREALKQTRRDGFASNDREEYENFIGIAAPVFNYLSEPVAVLNLWTSTPRHSYEQILGWAEDLKNAAGNVTGLIGGVAPEVHETLDA